MTQQGFPPRRQGFPSRRSASPPARPADGGPADGGPARGGQADGQELDAFATETDEDLPPWAGPSIYPRGPGRREIRPPRPGRDARDLPEPGGGRGPYGGSGEPGRRRAARNPYPGQDSYSGNDPRSGQPPYPGDPGSPSAGPGAGPGGRDGGRYPEPGRGQGEYEEPAGRGEYQEPGNRRDYERPGRPGGPGLPGRSSGRAAAARARRSRRRLYVVAGAVVAAVIVILGVLGDLPFLGGSPRATSHSDLVTTFQPGELRAVPSACSAVAAATLHQYLPGTTARVAADPLPGRAESQCTWTLDAKPVYRVLQVTSQAYAPNLDASGTGSATFNAIDGYNGALAVLRNPPRKTRLPKARLGAAPGLGGHAFSALQVVRTGGDTTFLVTVLARYRNVLVTVVMQGLDHASKGGYGPVPVATLQAGALAATREVLAGLH